MSDVLPVSHYADLADLGPRRRLLTVHASPRYWQEGGEWREVREGFVAGAAPWVAHAAEGVHALAVRRDGLALCRHVGHELAFRLRGLVALDAAGSERELLAVDLSAWTLDASALEQGVVAWQGPHGARYEICYRADHVGDRLVLTDELRQAIGGALPAGATRFGLAVDCSMPPGLTRYVGGVPQTEHDTEQPIVMLGTACRQMLRPAFLLDPRPSTLDPSSGWRERWRYANGRLLQTVPLDALDHVADLRTAVTYQEGLGGYSGCEDNHLETLLGGTTANYGGSTYLAVRFASGSPPTVGRPLVEFDVSAIPGGSTVNSADLELYCFYANNTTLITPYRVLVSWVEGTSSGGVQAGSSCWAYREYNTLAWGTAGCAQDDVDAESSGQCSAVSVSSTGWKTFDIQAATQAWVNGSDNHGVLLRHTEASDAYSYFRSSDYTTDTAQRPKLTIDYTAAGGTQHMPILSAAGVHSTLFRGLVTQG
jgi:hypothetical protein